MTNITIQSWDLLYLVRDDYTREFGIFEKRAVSYREGDITFTSKPSFSSSPHWVGFRIFERMDLYLIDLKIPLDNFFAFETGPEERFFCGYVPGFPFLIWTISTHLRFWILISDSTINIVEEMKIPVSSYLSFFNFSITFSFVKEKLGSWIAWNVLYMEN